MDRAPSWKVKMQYEAQSFMFLSTEAQGQELGDSPWIRKPSQQLRHANNHLN